MEADRRRPVDAHRHIHAGGGIETSDHVRELLRVENRMMKIAEMHRKGVDHHGGGTSQCVECGLAWRCSSYDWAREDSDRGDTTTSWCRADDTVRTANGQARIDLGRLYGVAARADRRV